MRRIYLILIARMWKEIMCLLLSICLQRAIAAFLIAPLTAARVGEVED